LMRWIVVVLHQIHTCLYLKGN